MALCHVVRRSPVFGADRQFCQMNHDMSTTLPVDRCYSRVLADPFDRTLFLSHALSP